MYGKLIFQRKDWTCEKENTTQAKLTFPISIYYQCQTLVPYFAR